MPGVEPREGTEVPELAAPEVAIPAPFFFTAVLWMGAFFAIAWGFRVVFMRLSGGSRPFAGDDGRSPDAEDMPLEERGPDRS